MSTTTTTTTYLLESDADDAKVRAAADKAAKAAERAAAKAAEKQAKADAKAVEAAAKIAAAADALTVAVAAVGEFNEADAVARRAAEAATGTPLANVMLAIAKALDSGVQAKALSEAGVVIGGKAVKADTVAKYAIGGRALRLGGDTPDLLDTGSVAHRVRKAVESAIERKVGRKALNEAIGNSTTIAAAVAAIDALEGEASDPVAPTVLRYLKAASGPVGKAAGLADEGIAAADADEIIALADEMILFLKGIIGEARIALANA